MKVIRGNFEQELYIDPVIVQAISDATERVKEGGITAISISLVDVDGVHKVYTASYNDTNHTLVGLLEDAKRAVFDLVDYE